MLIQVKARYDYGQVRFYPLNEAAKHLCKLTKTSTLTTTMLRHAKSMGATLECSNLAEVKSVLPELDLFREGK
jgi:hypothetical protein